MSDVIGFEGPFVEGSGEADLLNGSKEEEAVRGGFFATNVVKDGNEG